MGDVRIIDAATGQPVTVDDGEASRGLAEGRYRASGPVAVRLRDGRVASFDTGDAAAAFMRSSPSAIGIDTPEYAEQRELQREYGGRPLEAGALGAARGASLGLSDFAIGGVGGILGAGEETAEVLRELQERNPEASLGGEVAGVVAPLVLSGGTAAPEAGAGLFVRGARAVGAPVRGLAALAEGAGAATARALAGTEAGLARRVLARAAGGAVEGAVEGVGGELGHMVSEEALGENPDLTAEQVLARVGTGALLGGGIGGVLGGGGALLGEGARAGRDAVDVLRGSWGARVGTDLDPAVAAAIARTAESSDPADVLRRLASGGEDGRRVLRVLEGGEGMRDAHIRELRAGIDDLIRVGNHVEDFARGSMKREAVARRIDAGRIADQVGAAQGLVQRARSVAQELADDRQFYEAVGRGRGRALLADLDQFERQIAGAMPDGGDLTVLGRAGAADVYIALDQLKRRIGQYARESVRDVNAAQRLQGLYDDFISPLEDGAMWGDDLAAMQREVNQRWTRYLGRAGEFDQLFTARGPRDIEANPWRILNEADPARLAGFLDNIGTAANDRRVEIFREVVDARADLGAAIAEHMDVPSGLAAEVAQSPGVIARLRRILGDAEDAARVRNQWRRAREEMGGAGVGGAIRGAMLGGANAGGALGGVMGAFGPQNAVRALAGLRRFSRQADERIGTAVSRYLSSGREAGERVARAARQSTPLGGLAAYRRRSERLDEERADLPQRIERATRDLGDAPQVRSAIQATAARGVDYLARTRPVGVVPSGMLARSAPPTGPEINAWLRRAQVVDDPMSVLRALEDGSLTAEHVDALRNVYPGLHANISAAVASALNQSQREPTYQQRVMLDILLGVPTDASLRPEILATLQSVHASQQTRATPPQRGSAPNLAPALASGTERLEVRRA